MLYEHAAVREAAVVGVPDEYRGETVKAFVSLKAGQDRHRGRAHRLLQGADGGLQVPAQRRVPRRAAEDGHRQDPAAGAAGAVGACARKLRPRFAPRSGSHDFRADEYPVRGRGYGRSFRAHAAEPLSGQADLGACLLQLLLGGFGGVLGDALEDRLRGRLHEVLGLLQAQAGHELAHDLDDLDLLLARGLEDDVELVLLLLGGSGGGTGGRGGRASIYRFAVNKSTMRSNESDVLCNFSVRFLFISFRTIKSKDIAPLKVMIGCTVYGLFFIVF